VKRKLTPRYIVKVCKCGCPESAHNRQGPYNVSFGPGKSEVGYKLHCRVCKTECGLSTRVLS
jgi:hypothetical protein